MTAPLDKWSGVYLALVVAWLMGCLFLTVMLGSPQATGENSACRHTQSFRGS